MAHKIDNSKGFNSFVAFQAPAWHNLGKIYTEPITTQQALQDGGMDFQVIKLPNVHNIPQDFDSTGTPQSFIEIISDDSFFTYRTDVNKVLGTRLGSKYEVLQNEEALNVVDDILQSGKATIETAGVIEEGRRVFICLKIDKSLFVGGNDEVKQYAVICNSHDGSMAITVLFTNIRVVCYNTLTAALNEATGTIKIRHTRNAQDRLKEAAKVLKLIEHNTELNTENYNRMKETIISKEQMFDYWGNIFFSTEEIKALQAGKREIISTRKKNQMNELLSFANNGIGQNLALTNGKDFNMWYAFNAITGYVTKNKYSSVDDRANSLLFGTGAATIQEAGVLALAPEKILPVHKVGNSKGWILN